MNKNLHHRFVQIDKLLYPRAPESNTSYNSNGLLSVLRASINRYWLVVIIFILLALTYGTDAHTWAATEHRPLNETVPPMLTLQKVGNGAVIAAPPGPEYIYGQVVTLTAVADFGWEFLNWSGDLNSPNNPATVTMLADKTVRANFAQQPASTLVSTDFNSCTLDNRWTFIDPVGDTKLVLTGEQVEIQIPGGSAHDLWTEGNHTARLMQTANNVDFETEVKFESQVSQGYQLQGILVEQDAQNLLRFNFQSDGASVSVIGISFTNGVPTIQFTKEIPDTAAQYMRVRRTGDHWQLFYSANGIQWDSSALLEFTHPMTVAKAGIFAGNAGANPAFTAIVDYFFNTAAPVAPEDPIKRTVPVAIVGQGTVAKSCGSPVTLTAKPAPGWNFSGWSGSLTGNQNPATLSLSGSQAVTATFVPKALQLKVSVSGSGAVLLKPNQLYFDSGDVVTLTAVANPGWIFVNWSGDLTGDDITQPVLMNSNKTLVANFRLLSDNSGIQSDDFNACLVNSGRWSFINPLGDAQVTMTGAQAQITVPAGVDHDIWVNGNRAPRLMQPSQNTDFELEAKFESKVEKNYQFQGILVEGDANNFIRFNFQSDGNATSIVAISFTNGTPNIQVNQIVADGAAYLRVLRTGDKWFLLYSYDGTAWVTNATLTFTHPLTVTKVGVFAGNAGSNPAFISLIDYFFNTSSPISPEDPVVNTFPPVTIIGNGAVTRTPACGNPMVLTATPAANWQFAGWSGDLTGSNNPITFTAQGEEQIIATFVPLSGFYSDDFNTCTLNRSTWTFINPKRDGTVALKDGQRIELFVPAGADHDIFPIPNSSEPLNRAPRLMQAIHDVDFELEAKFDSAVQFQYQIQGVLIEQDSENFLRFDLHHNGATPRIAAIRYTDGNPTVVQNDVLLGNAPWHMRIKRERDLWALRYSDDGLTWTTVVTFTHALKATQAGVFVGNAGDNPMHTALVDYLFETSTPIFPEDSKSMGLITNLVGGGKITKTPEQSSYSCNTEVELLATPDNGWIFSGWEGSVTGAQNPVKLTIDGSKVVTATFTQQTYQLDVNISGSGRVTRTPSKNSYLAGESVTLTAEPLGNAVFVRWEGDMTSTANPVLLTMNGNKQVVAVFAAVAPSGKLYLPLITK